jgi:hypothetical protein
MSSNWLTGEHGTADRGSEGREKRACPPRCDVATEAAWLPRWCCGCCGPTHKASRCRVADVEAGAGQRQLTTLKRANTLANTSAVLHLRPRLSSTTQPRVLTVHTSPVPRHVMPWHAMACRLQSTQSLATNARSYPSCHRTLGAEASASSCEGRGTRSSTRGRQPSRVVIMLSYRRIHYACMRCPFGPWARLVVRAGVADTGGPSPYH